MATKKTTPAKRGRKAPGTAVVSPADWEKQLAAEAQVAFDDEPAGGGGAIIRATQDKQFETGDGASLGDQVSAVILAASWFNTLYDSAYDPGDPVPPACYAVAEALEDLAPAENAPNVQADVCDGCWANEFGSADVGEGKACRNGRRLALLLPESPDEVAVMTLSPTALRHYSKYVRGVAKLLKRPPHGVVTRFYFDDGSTYASVRFELDEPVQDPDLIAAIMGHREAAQERVLELIDTSEYISPEERRSRRKVAAKKAPARKKAAAKKAPSRRARVQRRKAS